MTRLLAIPGFIVSALFFGLGGMLFQSISEDWPSRLVTVTLIVVCSCISIPALVFSLGALCGGFEERKP